MFCLKWHQNNGFKCNPTLYMRIKRHTNTFLSRCFLSPVLYMIHCDVKLKRVSNTIWDYIFVFFFMKLKVTVRGTSLHRGCKGFQGNPVAIKIRKWQHPLSLKLSQCFCWSDNSLIKSLKLQEHNCVVSAKPSVSTYLSPDRSKTWSFGISSEFQCFWLLSQNQTSTRYFRSWIFVQ